MGAKGAVEIIFRKEKEKGSCSKGGVVFADILCAHLRFPR